MTIKSYTDLEQSKKLAEILPIESADMFYSDLLVDGNHKYNIHPLESFGFKTFEETKLKTSDHLGFIPCWSLAGLISVLPLVDFTTPQLIGTPKTLYRCMYNDNLKSHAYDNPIDACVEMIVKLHELNLL